MRIGAFLRAGCSPGLSRGELATIPFRWPAPSPMRGAVLRFLILFSELADRMRVLVDLVHPAHVLFFRRTIEILRSRGDAVRLVSRRKDITCDLLDALHLEHLPLTRAGKGKVGLAGELLARDWCLLREARRFRPDVMVGFGGVSISHVGRLLGIPTVAVYDSENAALQNRLAFPWLTHLYVPSSYTGPTPAGRTTRWPGIKSLAFLHPSTFTPDREIACHYGLDPSQDNFFVRVVSWQANHDLGKAGWSALALRELMELLSKRGRVHLSSELHLPRGLEPYRYSGPPQEIHHLLGHCRLYVGESATMACEAALLGTPAIYGGHDKPGYVRELEEARLVFSCPSADSSELTTWIAQVLAMPPGTHAERLRSYLRNKPDWTPLVVEALDRHAAGRSDAIAS